jgi:glycosyltransferase involved in cell wall biosynthesis
MRTDPLVSVIIPTYNRASLLCQTIDNVLKQTYRNFELIIVDDGSTDDTLARLRTYGNRIRIIAQDNAGPAVARNRGAREARGEIIAFQDSDDLWKLSKLQRQVAFLEKVGPSTPCCLCNVVMRVVNGKELTSFDIALIRLQDEESVWLNAPEVLATRFVLFNQAVAIRRGAFEKVGGFREDMKYDEDYDLALRLALEGPWAMIREPLVMYGEGSPESFSGEALRNPIILKECELAIFGDVLASLKRRGAELNTQRQLRHRIKTFRIGLHAAQQCATESFVARWEGRFLKRLDRYYHAAFRRSPWFPKTLTIPPTRWTPDGEVRENFESVLK